MAAARGVFGAFGRVLCLALLLAGVGNAAVAHEMAHGIQPHPALVDIDWSEATRVEVELGDHHYEPDRLELRRGRPYKLILNNVGKASHDMVGGSLFDESVIALRMVNASVGRVIADYVNSVYVRSQNSIELWFVPLKAGRYSFHCSLPGHREDGMEGIVDIVP